MTKRMLIDASHAEETRVVVLDGNRLEDFDVETATKRQLKGNIYLAKVVRIEPSLQAAFVEYGGNRHGFLAFSEIHPDYYQIPVADRQRLLELQAEQARAEEEAEDADDAGEPLRGRGHEYVAETMLEPEAEPTPEPVLAGPETEAAPAGPGKEPEAVELAIDYVAHDSLAAMAQAADGPFVAGGPAEPAAPRASHAAAATESDDPPAHAGTAQPARIETDRLSGPEHVDEPGADDFLGPADDPPIEDAGAEPAGEMFAREPGHDPGFINEPPQEHEPADERVTEDGHDGAEEVPETVEETPPPESLGGDSDAAEEARERRSPPRFLRNYKIQEVVRRRQIMLVQVVKEERGTKGAALTTYVSLAGRYCVLMPNSPRGGGISRKITSPADRRRLKEITAELDIPQGMGLIVRTAGANRPKPEIKRDCEYLLRLWDDIRETTMRSIAPSLIYEEASLIKRAIRDVYSRDIDEVTVDGEEGWRGAHEFMRMLMPTHARKVIRWEDHRQPLFARYQVEAQLDAIMSPTVQLRSGGYLVINQTEALVAIDVNSGRSTRERNIEETALRTNLEAAEELARQLRLRDLAGLIVIDFIDMEQRRHNAMVERRLKEALKTDRARLQVGHISHFGLLEMSRQRLRPSLAETTLVLCPNCGGTGHVRSTESAAIHVLRGIEEEAASRRAAEIRVHAAGPIVMYILNHKRDRLTSIEQHYAMRVMFEADDGLISPQMRIERLRPPLPLEPPPRVAAEPAPALAPAAEPRVAPAAEAEAAEEKTVAEAPESTAETLEESERRRRRRRRRRRPGNRDETTVMPEGAEQPEIAEPAQISGVAASGNGASENGASENGALAYPQALVAAPAEPDRAAPAEPAASAEPAETAGAASEGAERPSRHRGRRGGRRRRPEGAEPVAENFAVAEPPVYAGPTPANPFGAGAFDIFDVLEQAEQAPLAPVALRTPPPPPAEEPPVMVPAAEPASVAHEALETAAAPGLAEQAPAEPPVPEPAPAEPAIKPIVIAAAPPPEEKKRGWWRR